MWTKSPSCVLHCVALRMSVPNFHCSVSQPAPANLHTSCVLRAPNLPADTLVDNGCMQRAVLSDTTGTKLSGRMWRQATTTAALGGLGMRQAAEMQFAPFIASRTEARELAADVAGAFLASFKEAVFKVWEEDVLQAIPDWVKPWSPAWRR